MAAKEKQTRNRNPAFPVIGLETALDRAQVLYTKERRKAMRVETAAKHWGYSVTSSAAQQALSAMKQYGLLVDEKDGNVRKVRLSQIALRILLDNREGSTERLEALRETATSPKVFAELWRKADDDGSLPSDTELEHYLTLERKQPFFPDAVKNVIKHFRSTILLARLGKDDIIDQELGHGDGGVLTREAADTKGDLISSVEIAKAVPLPVLESDGSIRVINIPPLSEKAFAFFKTLLDTYKTAIVKQPPSSTDETNNSPSE